MSGNVGKHKNIGPGDSEPLLKILRNIRDIAGIGAISTVENSRELYLAVTVLAVIPPLVAVVLETVEHVQISEHLKTNQQHYIATHEEAWPP